MVAIEELEPILKSKEFMEWYGKELPIGEEQFVWKYEEEWLKGRWSTVESHFLIKYLKEMKQ